MKYEKHLPKSFVNARTYSKTDYRSMINLSSNELFCEELESVLADFVKTINPNHITQYTYYPFFRKIYANHYQVKEEEVQLYPGSDNAIHHILQICGAKTKRLILQSPNYYNYERYAALYKIHVTKVSNSLRTQSGKFVNTMKNCIKQAKPSLIVLTNPCSISGRLIKLEQILEIIEVANKNNHLILIDEAYIGFTATSHLPLLKQFSNLIILHTLSKFPGMAGIRLAFTFSSPMLIEALSKGNPENAISRITLEYFNFIIEDANNINMIKEKLLQNKLYLTEKLKKARSDIEILETHSNFILANLGSKRNVLDFINRCENAGFTLKNLFHLKSYESTIRITVPSKSITDELCVIL